jgi:hypothetical protein
MADVAPSASIIYFVGDGLFCGVHIAKMDGRCDLLHLIIKLGETL